ncbi:MAG: hypothetical protein H6841_05455 [Planctomycetes bacterium]|nr:hypothetical protein [Planctomycetota bacterium]MCB9935060.1 hypothetical protein [Planctomycetota bacterium]
MRNPLSQFFFWFIITFSPAPLVGFGTWFLVHAKEPAPPAAEVAPRTYGPTMEWVPAASPERRPGPDLEPAPLQADPDSQQEPEEGSGSGCRPYQRKQMDGPRKRRDNERPDL